MREARRFGVDLGEKELALFESYLDFLLERNESVNLTAVRDRDGVAARHFLDSLSVVPRIPAGSRTVADIGSGAGFPGVPVKIARPELDVTLVESVAKKADFLIELAKRLGLGNVRVANVRAEELGNDPTFRESFDVVLARAVASLPVLAEYALPLAKVGGLFIAQKSAGSDELGAAAAALRELGGELVEATPVDVPGLEPRQLVIVRKTSPTPAGFPRRTGVPSKRPL